MRQIGFKRVALSVRNTDHVNMINMERSRNLDRKEQRGLFELLFKERGQLPPLVIQLVQTVEFEGKERGLNTVKPARPTDLIIVAGYPKLIPRRIIELPSIGIINIHMSLLPAYRGRHPLNWAIINGEKYAGVTIHHISEKFDEGNIICQDRISIKRYDTIADVYAKAVRKGNSLLGKTFRMIGSRQFKGIKQDRRYASYFPPRTPKDGKINWNEPADKIRNLVRALVDPYPGAFFYYRGKKKIVDEVDILPHIQRCDTKIGKPFLLNGCYTIKTCDGFIKLVKLRNSTM